MKRTIAIMALVAMTFVGALAALAHSIPGPNGNVPTNIPSDPGAGRARVAEEGGADKLCHPTEHIRMKGKITVASGQAVTINAADIESQGASGWFGVYDGTITSGDLAANIFSDGTHTVVTKHMPDTHSNSYNWYWAIETADETPPITGMSVLRECVLD